MRERTLVVSYVVFFVVLLLLHYLVPYTVFSNCRDLSLLTYWIFVVLAWIFVSIVFTYKWWKSYGY